ncbi:MAG: hypothetical protein EA422_10150 [Gemmatimonadales bacterium]|nr:MAG: hypothetical protein EA422_10150 [Gemmatimonadales bacterium]
MASVHSLQPPASGHGSSRADRASVRPSHHRRHLGVAVLLFAVTWGCSSGGEGPPATSAVAPGMTATPGVAVAPVTQVARSTGGMVSTASVPATAVGASVLAAGGNAADAAVAIGFVLSVTEASMSGIGGRSAIIVRTPDGEVYGIDGLNQVPAGFSEGEGAEGYERATVPGVPAALEHLRSRFGSWESAPLLEPAVALARDGFPLAGGEARRWNGAAEELAAFPGSAPYIQPEGREWQEGDHVRLPVKARVLETLAIEGIEAFYHGWIADSIQADMERSGGFVTRGDMEAYRALTALPVEGTYRSHTVLSNFRPASGHAVIQALQTVEQLEEGRSAPASRLHGALLLGESLRHAIEDRNRVMGDEASSARHLTSPEYAQERATEIRRSRSFAAAVLAPDQAVPAGRTTAPGPAATATGHALPGAYRASFVPALRYAPGTLVTDPSDREATTHFTVVDADGMVVSVTQSLGPSLGTRVASPSLGFLYATRLGTEPGSRPSSTISPTIVLDPTGNFLMALGGAGDARIISAVTQVIHAAVGRGLSLEAAVAEPRMHPLDEDEMRVEEGPISTWSAAEWDELEGMDLQVAPSPSGYFGRVHAVGWDGSLFLGVAEPRWEGSAAGPQP